MLDNAGICKFVGQSEFRYIICPGRQEDIFFFQLLVQHIDKPTVPLNIYNEGPPYLFSHIAHIATSWPLNPCNIRGRSSHSVHITYSTGWLGVP